MSEEPTVRVGEYEILGVLDRGGMGSVFKVRNVISDRIEAMKILLPDLAGNPELAERFRREIKILASLDHPNIAALRTALSWDNRMVMIMEYVEGITLAARLERGPLSVPEALDYTEQVLEALIYAHGRKIIHRDIKPGNIMLTPRGGVKLMDFGIARCDNDATLTMTGTTLGSLHYMSPEQVQGRAVDERSDIYSLGISLYEMVTGKKPFETGSNYSIMVAHVEKQPSPPIALRPDLPAQLSEIILRAMAKDPSQRFQSAADFRRALLNLGGSITAPTSAFTQPADRLHHLMSTAAVNQSTSELGPSVPGPPSYSSYAPPASNTLSAFDNPAPSQPLANEFEVTVDPRTSPAAPTTLSRTPTRPPAHRGLYISLGALIVLVLLAVASVFLPHRNRTQAAGRPNRAEPSAVAPKPAASTSESLSTPPSGLAQQPEQPSVSTKSEPGDLPAKTNPSPTPGYTNASRRASGLPKSVESNVSKANLPEEVKAPSTSPSSVPVDVVNQAPNSTSQPGAGVDREQLQQLDHDLDLLTSRAESINESLETLRQEQRSQGLGLRLDIASAQQRLQKYLTRAESALKNQDAPEAKRYRDLAETEASTLEKFLGR